MVTIMLLEVLRAAKLTYSEDDMSDERPMKPAGRRNYAKQEVESAPDDNTPMSAASAKNYVKTDEDVEEDSTPMEAAPEKGYVKKEAE